ncbi:MAG: hypothetical protein VZS44_07905 [Bacilli bacterium]|nr:hypothetical protein [Bacilli bacterium]
MIKELFKYSSLDNNYVLSKDKSNIFLKSVAVKSGLFKEATIQSFYFITNLN